jgi:hypothetical protein
MLIGIYSSFGDLCQANTGIGVCSLVQIAHNEAPFGDLLHNSHEIMAETVT